MCFSILKVSFKNDNKTEMKECATEKDERDKISDLRDKDQVAKVAVFRCHRHESRKEVWDSTPYQAPVAEVLP